MARKFTAAQRTAIAVRMRAYWAKKRKDRKAAKTLWNSSVAAEETPPAAKPSMVVRVIATRDQGDGARLIMHEHGVSSWGGLIDLLQDAYDGQFTEVLIRKG